MVRPKGIEMSTEIFHKDEDIFALRMGALFTMQILNVFRFCKVFWLAILLSFFVTHPKWACSKPLILGRGVIGTKR